MELLSNPAVGVALLSTIIAIGVWLFKKLFDWVESLTKDVTNLTTIVAVLGERMDNAEDDLRDMQSKQRGTPKVNYKK